MVKHPAEAETRSQIAPDAMVPGRARLVAIWDGGHESCSLPAEGRVVIGRGLSCDLVIGSESASRQHAVVHAGSPPRIEDLGSSNGTRVDGRRLGAGELADLLAGQSVQLGDTLLVLQLGAPGARPAETATGSADGGREAMDRLGELVRLVATGTLSVILEGETGSGKEVFARRIHDSSPRRDRPYVRINCAALPESMAESELFGHAKGAFTGAQKDKRGLLEMAQGGTVLLDEVVDLTLPLQAKLLRAVDNLEIYAVGSTTPTRIDVRFIAATNQSFQQRIGEGRFRADLFYRLNGITLSIPPLRDRRWQILPLAEEFAVAASDELGRKRPQIGPETVAAMMEYPWPGNVRELKQAIERAVLLAQGGSIEAEHLALDASGAAFAATTDPQSAPKPSGDPTPAPAAEPASSLRNEIEQLERQRILDAIQQCAGNQTQAAKLLGMSRRALLNRLDAYGVPRPRKGRGKVDGEP